MSNNEHRLTAAEIIADIASDMVERKRVANADYVAAASYTYWNDAVEELGFSAACDLLRDEIYKATCRRDEQEVAR